MESKFKAPSGFFLGELGMVLRYLIEGDNYVIRPDLKPLAKKLRKDFMSKRAIESISAELDKEEPNTDMLRILKMKLESRFNQIKKEEI